MVASPISTISSDAAPAPDFDFNAELRKQAEAHQKMVPKLKEVRETIKGLKNKVAIAK